MSSNGPVIYLSHKSRYSRLEIYLKLSWKMSLSKFPIDSLNIVTLINEPLCAFPSKDKNPRKLPLNKISSNLENGWLNKLLEVASTEHKRLKSPKDSGIQAWIPLSYSLRFSKYFKYPKPLRHLTKFSPERYC